MEVPQAPAQRDQRQAPHDRERADDPDDGDGATRRVEEQQQPEQDRQDPTDRQPQLAGDLLPQPDGEHDLDDAGDDRPGRDDQQQRGRRDAREGEGQDPGDDADRALEDRQPEGAATVAVLDGARDVEDAIHQRPGPEQQHEGRDRRWGRHERDDPEDDRQDPPQDERPPVARELDSAMRKHHGPPPATDRTPVVSVDNEDGTPMQPSEPCAQRFTIAIGRRSRWLLRLFGVTDSNASVSLDGELDARFGFGRIRTPMSNVASWRIEGPWPWITAIGIRRNWLKQDLAFDGVHQAGVRLEFRDPPRPFGLRVNALYVTVEDIEGFTAALRARGIDGVDARHSLR